MALFNELYDLASGGSLWTAASSADPVGQFGVLECLDYAWYESLDVRLYGSFALLQLWPELDKAVLRSFARAIPAADATPRPIGWYFTQGKGRVEAARKLAGATPHDLGAPNERPFEATNYILQTIGPGPWVAGGDGNTVKMIYSTDGINWTGRTMPLNRNWRVGYGNGVFVAVATDSTDAASSTDGITWTSRTTPSAASWEAVTYGNGVFVTIGYPNSAATSTNGTTWTARTLPSSRDWQSLAYGNGIFVALTIGSDYTATSPDGVTWTQRALGSAMWESVVYGG
jgi:hypothetical protein